MAGIEVREGRLSKTSRLYRHLTEKHRAAAMRISRHPDLVLVKLSGSHNVFLMKDRDSGREHVLKSFAERGAPARSLKRYLDHEYDSLKCVGKAGIAGRHWGAAKPVCRDREALFFVEQRVKGTLLDVFIRQEMAGGRGRLDEKLDLLAGFFASLHARTETRHRVDASPVRRELERHATQSHGAGGLDRGNLREAKSLIRDWCASRVIRHAHQSLTHGDATTTNFIFRGDRVFAIDMERSRCRDPVYDLGMMAGELFNAALRETPNPYNADRFIRHLYWTYAGNFRDRRDTFDRLTARNPLYMANSLLRMSRNDYFSREYRRRLAFYALECLRSIGHKGH